MTSVGKIYSGLLTTMMVMFLMSCVNKFFPDKTLYQYPKKTNDVAVVYPDGSIHHSDGTVSYGEKNTSLTKPDNASVVADSTEEYESSSANTPDKNTSSVKDASGRHAKYRGNK